MVNPQIFITSKSVIHKLTLAANSKNKNIENTELVKKLNIVSDVIIPFEEDYEQWNDVLELTSEIGYSEVLVLNYYLAILERHHITDNVLYKVMKNYVDKSARKYIENFI